MKTYLREEVPQVWWEPRSIKCKTVNLRKTKVCHALYIFPCESVKWNIKNCKWTPPNSISNTWISFPKKNKNNIYVLEDDGNLSFQMNSALFIGPWKFYFSMLDLRSNRWFPGGIYYHSHILFWSLGRVLIIQLFVFLFLSSALERVI